MIKYNKYLSPITLRILAVNIGALIILAFGLLYTGEYETEMIDAQMSSLKDQGQLLAAALAGGGVRETLQGDPVLTEDLSRHMLRKLAESNTLHTILFNKIGHLLLDSGQLQGAGGNLYRGKCKNSYSAYALDMTISLVAEGVKVQFEGDMLPYTLNRCSR